MPSKLRFGVGRFLRRAGEIWEGGKRGERGREEWKRGKGERVARQDEEEEGNGGRKIFLKSEQH
jgi:hypothetical protein